MCFIIIRLSIFLISMGIAVFMFKQVHASFLLSLLSSFFFLLSFFSFFSSSFLIPLGTLVSISWSEGTRGCYGICVFSRVLDIRWVDWTRSRAHTGKILP